MAIFSTVDDAWTSIRADVQEVVDSFVTGGDSNVFYFEFAPQSSPYGEDWHPTVATHEAMARRADLVHRGAEELVGLARLERALDAFTRGNLERFSIRLSLSLREAP